MFHILSTNNKTITTADAAVLCGAPIRRSVISQDEYKSYKGQGKLHTDRCCKACLKLMEGGKYWENDKTESAA